MVILKQFILENEFETFPDDFFIDDWVEKFKIALDYF